MKNLVPAILLLSLAIPTFAQGKTDDELLQKTVALSKEVKAFGKTIGIEPTDVLSKSAKEQKPFSLLIIHIQKKGSIDLSVFERAALSFEINSEHMPIAEYYLHSMYYSIFIRQVNEFANNNRAAITVSFAKMDLPKQVMVILHEDLHSSVHVDNLSGVNNLAETLTTPLGFLAALKFFEHKNNLENTKRALYFIEYYKKFSLELNALEKEIKELSSNVDSALLCATLYEKEILSKYPIYSAHLTSALKPYDQCVAEEAAITSDLMYWKYFGKVVNIYEKSKDLKTLIEEMKNAPARQNELEKFLDDLDKKYSKPATE